MKLQKHPYHGFISLDKPLGMTSADAVNRAKRLLRPTKIGHAGTLDPLASGILPLALGEGTKCINLLMDAKKTYAFAITFGERRSTDDAEGQVIATSDRIPTEQEIHAILPRFTGRISQTPPIYSALKVEGKRAYDLARAGEEVTLAAREVEVFCLEYLGVSGDAGAPLPSGEVGFLSGPMRSGTTVTIETARLENPGEGGMRLDQPRPHPDLQPPASTSPPQAGDKLGSVWANPASPGGRGGPASPHCHVAHFRATVSKGTYIRSLGRDIAQALGSEGYISHLRRLAVGPFTEACAISLDFLEKSAHNAPLPAGSPDWLMPLERALDDIPAVPIEQQQLLRLRQGQRVPLVPTVADSPQVAVLFQDQLVGLARVEQGMLIPTRLLVFESR